MFNSYMNAYLQYCKMVLDTTTVLNYRLPLLQDMASDPDTLWSQTKWFEINRMISEKMFAFGQANMLLAISVAQLPYGKLPSAEKLLQLQRKVLQPVKTTLSANARRVKKK
ncbi:MAG: hypothetical protein WBB23_08855 [Desulforhopalus sp.]